MRRVVLLPLCLLIAACPAVDPGVLDDGPINVGADGGRFVREGVVIEIPEGAVASLSQLTVTKVNGGIPDVEGRVRISEGWRIDPQALIFKKPITVGVQYLESMVPSTEIDPAEFDLRRKDAVTGQPVLHGEGGTDTEFKYVTGKTDRLGLFWATSPLPPGATTVSVDPPEAFLQIGGTQAFTAVVKDETGAVMNDVELIWEVYPPRAASIDPSGTVTALAPGIVTVVGRSGAAKGTARVLIPGAPSGSVTFQHENPFPTGEDLWAGTLFGGEPLVAGGNSTVLQRADDGSWARLFSSAGVLFRTVARAGDTLVGAGSFSTSGVLFEQSPSGLKTASLGDFSPRAIWFDGTHGMVAGFGNDILVRRNGEWVEDGSPTFETVLSVQGDGTGSFVAMGDLGSIFRYDPGTQSWSPVSEDRLPVLLSAAVVLDHTGTEAWAASIAELLHFKDGAWTESTIPTTPSISEVTALGVARGKVYVATRNQTSATIRTYDPVVAAGGGNGWTSSYTVRAPQVIRSIFGDANQAFAVGDLGAIYEFDTAAGNWRERSKGFYDDVTGVSAASDITVVAKRICLNADCSFSDAEVLYRNASGEWLTLGASQPFNSEILALYAVSSTEVYAGGRGFLYRWNGASWTAFSSSEIGSRFVADLTRCGDTLVVVGYEEVPVGLAVELQGRWWTGTDALTARPTLLVDGTAKPPLTSVSCSSKDSVIIAGSNALFENSIPRTNVDDPLTTDVNEGSFQNAAWTHVWSPAASEAYAFGGTYYGAMWNGYNLAPLQFPAIQAESVGGLWGTSVDNLYAVGLTVEPNRFGYAMRFNGVAWDWIDLGSMRRPLGIDGRTPVDSYVVTEKGGILRSVAP